MMDESELIPASCHTYSKGEDQFPANAPRVIERAEGAYCWDPEGVRYLDWGQGINTSVLGHRFPEVDDAVRRQMEKGVNFTRPSLLERTLAEFLVGHFPCAEMVKYGKNGSDVTTAALRLSRAVTQRSGVAVCADHPFFSIHDWFIGTTPMRGGIPAAASADTFFFRYNDLASLELLFREHPKRISAVFLEPVRLEPPEAGFLQGVVDLCRREGAVSVFDEMVTGMRWDARGAHHLFGVTPDLATFGKAISNGYSFSLLAGRRDILRLGGLHHDRRRVFLLSQTHGGETLGLAAARATIESCLHLGVTDHLARIGRLLIDGANAVFREADVFPHLSMDGYPCKPFLFARRENGTDWPALATVWQQELVARGILAPWWCPTWSHREAQVEQTLDAMRAAARTIAPLLRRPGDVEKALLGPPLRPVFRAFNRCWASRCPALEGGELLPCCEGFVPPPDPLP